MGERLKGLVDKIESFRVVAAAVAVFGLILLCVVWGGVYLKVTEEKETALNAAIRDTGNFARSFEEHSLRTIKSVDQTVLFLKYEYERSNEWISIPGYIKEGRLTKQPFVLLGVIDAKGDLRVSSQEPFVPSNLKDREHFTVHQKEDTGKLFISKPVLGRSSGKWSIQMTRRINKPDGSFGGVVVVSVDPFYFTEFYKSVDLGEDASVSLVGRDGIVRARRSGNNAEIGQNMNGFPLMVKAAEAAEGHYISNSSIDNIKRVFSYRSLEEYPLLVSVGITEEEILKETDRRKRSYYWSAAGVSIIIFSFITLLFQWLLQQRRVRNELQRARDSLEAQVGIRTQELFLVNKDLQEANATLQNEMFERKKAEAQVVQQEKMASIGQLAAGVAHEINNPMSYIISNLQMMQDYAVKFKELFKGEQKALLELKELAGLPEKAGEIADDLAKRRKTVQLEYLIDDTQELLTETLDGADRVKKIVQDLKSFARTDNVRAMANVNEGIQSAINIVWNELKYKASLERELGELPEIYCDLGQLNQVFMNIIMNAVQAIEENGIIKIRSWYEDSQVCVSIADNGKGIPYDVQNRIFEPFFTTKAVGEGTGLGLSVSYDIIRKHGGELTVESLPGQGATFMIRLPVEVVKEN